MKNLFLGLLVAGVISSIGQISKADPGMPKTFNLLSGVGGPILSGQLSEIKLNQFNLEKGQTCGSEATYLYNGPAAQLTIGGEVYVMDTKTSTLIDFVTDTCAMKSENISYFLMKFDHTKISVSVGVEVDMVHGVIRVMSRDLGGTAGKITSSY